LRDHVAAAAEPSASDAIAPETVPDTGMHRIGAGGA
jgi:hypothetical protein